MPTTVECPPLIEGERVTAVFPCIGGALSFPYVVDVVVVTHDDRLEKPDPFGVFRFTRPRGGSAVQPLSRHRAFPKALRAARRAQGWA